MLDQSTIKSIRSFIGARDFDTSRSFYSFIGFEENRIANNMSYFGKDNFGFYLQKAFVKDWIDNTMIFLEIEKLDNYQDYLKSLNLTSKFEGVRLSEIVENDWGREFFLHDPSGVLWHFGNFNSQDSN